MAGINLADVLRASNGDLTHKGMREIGIGSVRVRRVFDTLDKLGLTRFEGSRRKRVLVVSLEEALPRVEGVIVPDPPVANRRRRRALPYRDVMRLLHDPGGLFAPGAEFPSDQVLPRKWAPDEPGQWHVGTRFVRRRRGHPREYYEYDGERVARVEDGRR